MADNKTKPTKSAIDPDQKLISTAQGCIEKIIASQQNKDESLSDIIKDKTPNIIKDREKNNCAHSPYCRTQVHFER